MPLHGMDGLVMGGGSSVLAVTDGVLHAAAPTSPSAPRLAVTEKFTSLVSTTHAGESAVMPCSAQAHPIPRYRYVLVVQTNERTEKFSELLRTRTDIGFDVMPRNPPASC